MLAMCSQIEQQVRAVIRSLSASWANMKQILTYSESIKNFSDASQHVILEAETRDADKTFTYIAQGGLRNANGKRERQSKKDKKGEASTHAPKEGKIKKRKRGKCGATKHVARDREGFVDYHRISVGSKHIFMENNSSDESSYSYVVNDNIVNDSATWHARLGHIGQDIMTPFAREGLLGPLVKVNLQTCEACLAGKACKKPFGKVVKATQPLELVHSDICGPMSVKARHDASYFLTLIDDYTRYGYVSDISPL
ncbi:hypothetical protein RJ640_005748 [Escallonia rubra]|uniref:GAG-pre-integrase domain-containing protein n=1 Tax=Escallonia rubra TaxID=112253 RepID=A0AA88RLN6_9ASTE|nr:hypothetical protein RJ640_005748 [Escallonia rubra]